jgi:hypothetical protein
MGGFFGTLLNTLQARFIAIVTKIRVLLSPNWWKTKGFVALRGFFAKLFDFKPHNANDYYPLMRWLISKRLAFAIVIVLGVVSLYYMLILSPVAITGTASGNATLPVYRYNSLAIRFFDGSCRIKARGDYVAYEGAVKKGIVTGDGRLFDRNGNIVYDGAFDKNMYNGRGKLYYESGRLKYEGDFVNNEMNGKGCLYAASGTLRYDGAFLNGKKNGKGILYNGAADEIYQGNFVLDRIAYAEFVGKTAEEVATMYTGVQDIYASDAESILHMKEIGAVATVMNGEEDLEGQGKLTGLVVLENSFPSADKTCVTMSEIESLFGRSDYTGYTYCMLPEAVAFNVIADGGAPGTVALDTEQLFDGVYRVDDYDGNVEVYIHAYKAEDILYTFYCAGPQDAGFFMYSIEVGE